MQHTRMQVEEDAAWLAKAKAKEAEAARLMEEERRRKADRVVSTLMLLQITAQGNLMYVEQGRDQGKMGS